MMRWLRNLLLVWLLGKEFAQVVKGYRLPRGKHNSIAKGSPTSWSWEEVGLDDLPNGVLVSSPPSGKCRVTNILVDPAASKVVVEYNDEPIP